MNIYRRRGRVSGAIGTPFDQEGFDQSSGGVWGRRRIKPETGAIDEQLIRAARCFLRRVGS